MVLNPLVVAATVAEIEQCIPYLQERNIPYLITGVGMVSTCYALSKRIAKRDFSYIINIGIAGSLNKDLEIGSLVEIIEDTFSELGAQDGENFLSVKELGFGNATFTFQQPLNLDLQLLQVSGITVNTVHGNETSIHTIMKRFPSIQTESMEGAAVFYVCEQENIPCVQVRSISNYVEVRDKSRWNIPLAIQNINNWLLEHLRK